MALAQKKIKIASTALLVILLGFVIFSCVHSLAAQPPENEDDGGEEDTTSSSSTELSLTMSSSSPAPSDSSHHQSTSTSTIASSSTVDLSPDTVEKESKSGDKDDEEYDEEDDDEDDSGPILLSQFVRRFDTSAFIPSDFEALSQELERASATAQSTNQPLSSVLSAKFRHINDTLALINRAQAFSERLLAGSKDLKDTLLYISSLLSDRMVEAKLSAQCTADIANIGRALQERKLWAAKIIDAWGHLPSGMIAGHFSALGEFDQCISIRSGLQDNGEPSGRRIYGKYCPVQMRMPTPTMVQYSPDFEAILAAHPTMVAAREQILALDPKELEEMLPENIKGVDATHFLDFKLAQSMSEGNEAMKGAAGMYGVCLPASCSAEDIERLFNFIAYPLTGIPLQVKEKYCTVHEEARVAIKLDRFQRVAVVVFAIAIMLVLSSTVIHALLLLIGKVHQQQKSRKRMIEDKNGNPSFENDNSQVTVTNGKNTISINIGGNEKKSLQTKSRSSNHSKSGECTKVGRQLLLSFSAIANSEGLFSFNNRHAVLDTLRFSMTVIIFAVQAFGFTAGMSVQTLRSMLYSAPIGMGGGLRYWWLRCPGLWNDGFVFTFGVTLVFQQFNRLSKVGASFNYLAYLLRRWFRLSISVLGILAAMYLFPLVGDGPYWHNVDNQLVEACREPAIIRSIFGYYSNWNVLLRDYQVGAYFPICSFPTWFLSMSTQLYLIAPIFFLSMYYYPACGVTFTVLVLLFSPLITLLPRLTSGVVSYVELTKFASVSDMYATMQHYHMNPALYVTSLMIGMLTGYLIKTRPKMRIPGGYIGERILWLASFIGAVAIFVWFDSFWGDYRVENSAIEAMSWWIVSKFVFPGFLGVTCYLCCTGRGGTINRILTIRAIQPIAKLSFGIYLLRSLTIYYRIGTVRHTYPFYYWQAWQNIIFDYFTTAFLSYFLHILFDGPAMALIRLFETIQLDKLFGGSGSTMEAPVATASAIVSGKVHSSQESESTTKSVESLRKVIEQSYSPASSPPAPPSPPPSLASLKKVK